jgi:phosphomannomutase
LGGEESGGYGFRGHIPERDGILAGLYLLDYLIRTGKTPTQLLQDIYKKVGPHYYDRVDTHLDESAKKQILAKLTSDKIETILQHKVVKLDTRDGFRYKLDDGSWLLMRFSGTEPLVRIYAESGTVEDVQKLLQYGQELAGV